MLLSKNWLNRTECQSALWFVNFVAFLVALRLGVSLPAMPRLLQELLGVGPAGVASIYGIMISAGALVAFVSAPIVGWFSDKVGQGRVLIVSIACSIPAYVAFTLSSKLWVIVLAQFLASVSGGTIVAARAYLASNVPSEKRAEYFGRFNAAFTLGLISGPAISGTLAEYSVRAPFLLAAALTLASLVFGVFFLPLTSPLAPARDFNWRRLNPFSSICAAENGSSALRPLLLASFFDEVCTTMFNAVFALYFQLQLSWGAGEIGRSLTIFSASVFITQTFFAGPVIRKIGETASISIGNLLIASLLLLTALADTNWQVYLLMALIPIGTVAAPAFQSTLSRQVSSGEQGALQGNIGSLMALAATIGPATGTWIFAHTSSAHAQFEAPALVFVCASLLSLLSLVLCIFALYVNPVLNRSTLTTEPGE